MSKIRVYEYAKKHNISSKDVITKLKEMNIEVSNHMATIEDADIVKLDATYNKKEGNAQQKQTKPQQQNRQNQKPSESKQGQKPQVQVKTTPKAFEDDDDKTASPSKVKVVSPPKTIEGKKQNQEYQSKENKVFNSGKGNNKKPFNNNNQNRNNNNNKKKNHHTPVQQAQPQVKKVKELPAKITFSESLTVAELAKKLYREPSEIIKKLFLLGVMATINQVLDKDAIELIAGEYGVEVEEEIKIDTTDLEVYFTDDTEAELVERPSVVTIMGHVDHGKTTLLDSIRNTKVTEGEAGGITQHIGAYQVVENGKKITFLDTPGHAAFTTMRARGAKITDITILVVAADDGVMPQTVEAINHAKAAEVPIIVAVNKMDKEAANVDRVMQELTEHGLVSEAWGGETIFVPLSAKTGEGIDNLLEMILLVGEVEEYKANPNRKAVGTVIEAQLDKGRGSVATLLVQNGTLKIGDPIVVGNTFGRVRAMVNDKGRRVKEAGLQLLLKLQG
ncbi:translation initiation factor IF-2 [Neobacillus pocheonensis]|uniref:Translation initiation factor IF-2 n=1 Tax=Neobacillus pocheonensis TaxID=363869 RepID=A0ABT0WEF2_9BACI|nr:translation initiation factor IF-2 [Neobacillus pocheonensis]